MRTAKTWKEKLENGREPKVVRLQRPYGGLRAGTRMLVGTPMLVWDYIQQIPEGSTVSVATMRRDLSTRFGADAMCPASTGIFIRIVREATREEREAGLPGVPIERLVMDPPVRKKAGLQRRSAASAGTGQH